MRRSCNSFALFVVTLVLASSPARGQVPPAIAAPNTPTLTFLQKYGDGTKEPIDPDAKHQWFFKVLTRMEDKRASLEKRADNLDKALPKERTRKLREAGQPVVQQLMMELKEFLDDAEEAELWVNGFRGKPGYLNISSYYGLLLQNNLSLAEKAHAVHRRYYPMTPLTVRGKKA